MQKSDVKMIEIPPITHHFVSSEAWREKNPMITGLLIQKIEVALFVDTMNITLSSSLDHSSPGAKLSRSSVLTDKCLTCGKTFKRLITHLKKSIECQTSYDMEALEDFQNTKRKEQLKEGKRRSRQNQTPQKKAEEKVKNSEEKKIFRGNQTPEEKAEDKMKSKP